MGLYTAKDEIRYPPSLSFSDLAIEFGVLFGIISALMLYLG